jgi:glyoxylate reductase
LKSHPDFSAGLDVFEREPAVPRELWELPNALCLPHIGSATVTSRRKMAQICVEEAVRFADGKPLQYEFHGD